MLNTVTLYNDLITFLFWKFISNLLGMLHANIEKYYKTVFEKIAFKWQMSPAFKNDHYDA